MAVTSPSMQRRPWAHTHRASLCCRWIIDSKKVEAGRHSGVHFNGQQNPFFYRDLKSDHLLTLVGPLLEPSSHPARGFTLRLV